MGISLDSSDIFNVARNSVAFTFTELENQLKDQTQSQRSLMGWTVFDKRRNTNVTIRTYNFSTPFPISLWFRRSIVSKVYTVSFGDPYDFVVYTVEFWNGEIQPENQLNVIVIDDRDFGVFFKQFQFHWRSSYRVILVFSATTTGDWNTRIEERFVIGPMSVVDPYARFKPKKHTFVLKLLYDFRIYACKYVSVRRLPLSEWWAGGVTGRHGPETFVSFVTGCTKRNTQIVS